MNGARLIVFTVAFGTTLAAPSYRFDGAAAVGTFGTAVAVGDVNGDGHAAVIIGAAGHRGNRAPHPGCVFVRPGRSRPGP